MLSTFALAGTSSKGGQNSSTPSPPKQSIGGITPQEGNVRSKFRLKLKYVLYY